MNDPHRAPQDEARHPDGPPRKLQAVLDVIAEKEGRRLALVAAARLDHWCVLEYTAAGNAQLLVPAMEASALYTVLYTRMRGPEW